MVYSPCVLCTNEPLPPTYCIYNVHRNVPGKVEFSFAFSRTSVTSSHSSVIFFLGDEIVRRQDTRGSTFHLAPSTAEAKQEATKHIMRSISAAATHLPSRDIFIPGHRHCDTCEYQDRQVLRVEPASF